MISDIQLFLSRGSSFDPVKIANLFVKFNGLAHGKWTANTFKAYRDLKNYALSFDEFKNFTVEQDINRENLKQEKINKLSESLREKSKTLKEFITKNLTSKKTPRALELISKIEEILPSESINKLEKLNKEVGNWILNMANKTSVIKKKNPDLNANKQIKQTVETFKQRFERLSVKSNYKKGRCLGVILLGKKYGIQLTAENLAFAQKYIPRYLKAGGDSIRKQCRMNLKTAGDIDKYLTCLSSKSSLADAEFLAGIETVDNDVVKEDFAVKSAFPIFTFCPLNNLNN